MDLYINDMLYALSYALDCVEGELLGVKARHSERVAYMCVKTGSELGLSGCELSALAASSVLHDNALTEYISSERQARPANFFDLPASERSVLLKQNFVKHCLTGEKNVQILPFYKQVRGAVLCHHENVDGSGPLGRKGGDTPVFAQLIHIADMIDNIYALNSIDEDKYLKIRQYVDRNTGSLFSREVAQAFLNAFPLTAMDVLQGEGIRRQLIGLLPHRAVCYDNSDVQALATMFAKITDYKSHFTCTHSLGIAQKSLTMGKFYGRSEEECTKLYLAGALHDIGKLAIPNSILEKPGKLTKEEFDVMKLHATYTWKILSEIDGLGEIIDWASFHHEKLNGSGYPFGKKAAELGHNERLLCCVDIYQALTEPRPYKKGMSHANAIAVMKKMAAGGEIDGQITLDIDSCFAC